MKRKYDLYERLINFADIIIDISEFLPKSFAGNHIAGQLVRSGTAPALNYGEAQSAESRNDFLQELPTVSKRKTNNTCTVYFNFFILNIFLM